MKYHLTGYAYLPLCIDIEADSVEHAKEIAADLQVQSIRWDDREHDDEWHIGDAPDGVVTESITCEADE